MSTTTQKTYSTKSIARRSSTLRERLRNTRGLQTIEMIMLSVGAIVIVSLVVNVATQGDGGFGSLVKELVTQTKAHITKAAPQ